MFRFRCRDRSKQALITDLKKACKIASEYIGGYSGEFLDAKDFYGALKESISLFENGDDSQAVKLWSWFSPTTAWDDFVGAEGGDLGNSIYCQLRAYIDDRAIKI